jgi:hypothetical protein
MIPLIRTAIVQPCRRWIGEIKNPRKPASSTTPAVALIQAIAQITVSVPYFEKSIGAANASRGRPARRAVTKAIAIVPVIPSAPAMRAHIHAGFDSDGARRSRHRASCVLRGQPCPVTYHQKNESHPAVTMSIHGIEGSVRKFRITAMLGGIVPMVTTSSATRIPRRIAGKRLQKWLTIDSARLNSAASQFKNIRRRNKAAPTIKRFASRRRPENDRVGPPSATPR